MKKAIATKMKITSRRRMNKAIADAERTKYAKERLKKLAKKAFVASFVRKGRK